MSHVFSFRLDPNNPHEALAFEVILTWQSKGYSIRQIMTEALEKLNGESNLAYICQYDQMNEKLEEILEFLRSNQDPQFEGLVSQEREGQPKKLSNPFLASVKLVVQPGLRME